MFSKFIFSLLDFILLLVAFVVLAFLPVWNYLFGSGTPLKTCNLSQGSVVSEKTPTVRTIFTYKIFDRSSGNRPKIIGLPFQAGAMQSPSGQFV